ncbi:Rare lipoprotein A precursor [Minicystis rosea]|nr:Rare lipoprotein A precursor [Minicystis rosea]
MRSTSVAFVTVCASVLVGCAGAAENAYHAEAPQPAQEWSSSTDAPPPGWTPPPAAFGQAPHQRGRASYYSDRLAGRATATGEPYDPRALTAAHRTLPFGALVDVARTDGRHVIVRINDRGPFAHGRVIDLSRRAATEIDLVRAGVAEVALRVLWVPPPKRKRR